MANRSVVNTPAAETGGCLRCAQHEDAAAAVTVIGRSDPVRPQPLFRLLGPTEAHGSNGPVDLGAPQQRCVLMVLLLEPGRVVPLERLIDAVWPDDPPASARKAIQVYVSHLRRALADVAGAELVTVRPGYRMDVDPDDVDVHRFRALVERARSTGITGAAGLLSEALGLWRGGAVADMPNDGMREPLSAGLEEERLLAVEEHVVARLRLGQPQAVISELREYTMSHPLRERGYRLLMRALHDCGRQAEALAVYQDAREALAERLGTEPGPELRALHQQILRGPVCPEGNVRSLPARPAHRRRSQDQASAAPALRLSDVV